MLSMKTDINILSTKQIQIEIITWCQTTTICLSVYLSVCQSVCLSAKHVEIAGLGQGAKFICGTTHQGYTAPTACVNKSGSESRCQKQCVQRGNNLMKKFNTF